MAGYEINVGAELLPGLLNGPNGLAKLVESVLNQIQWHGEQYSKCRAEQIQSK